ncbi:FAD-dependent monooxygenase [Kitasatospora sp. NBC_01287]|uniref:FAD-dependent monooxygenase n=1 Tax=Kitasatospora sp. NBC_01287 TaxID=2903573 RepID=UPI0022595908|nr:FAD-dependent monooxygenase [Kitasatospora sp. NBC_01287]MCX4748059.1 FAD-dependent monooxygenase [Kitasatospora sp. NBC_01287]
MRNTRVLISGASVAGPALAFWLGRFGFCPTIVELAPQLRSGGHAVDFRGATHRTVLERMGILDELRELRTGGSPMSFVNASGRELLHLPGEFTGGELEVRRGDLAALLHRHSEDRAEYLFGDSVTAISEQPDGVRVAFQHGPERTFDLVIGADGIHSRTRQLVFGPEERFVRHLGYYVAGWRTPNPGFAATEGTVMYNEPGRGVGLAVDPRDTSWAHATLFLASPRLPIHHRDVQAQKRMLADAFAGTGWHARALLATLDGADDLYFDSISRADLPSWSKGRVALIGDAACGATLGGMGTGTAITAAYVLAGELATAEGDHITAFAAYEARLRGFAERCQQGGDRTGRFLAPKGRLGAALRNRMLSTRPMLDMMLRAGEKVTTLDGMPHYAGAAA